MYAIAPTVLSKSPSSGLVISHFGFSQTGIEWKAPLSVSGKGFSASSLRLLAEGLEHMVALTQEVFPSVLGLPPAPGSLAGPGKAAGSGGRVQCRRRGGDTAEWNERPGSTGFRPES